ncbi:MAG: DUF3592 domain-containing protein [Pseudomonadota bacterium]
MGDASSGSGGQPMLFGILLIIGIALAVFGVVFYRRGSARYTAAASWVQTQATIVASTFIENRQITGGNETSGYRAQATYRYQAAGAEHEGHRVWLCARTDWNSDKPARVWLAANPAGATVPVWYDPANPTDSALERNKPSLATAIILSTIGIAAVVIALFLFVAAAR